MNITERSVGDLKKLKEKARNEPNAKQRDRYRAVILAIEGLQTQAIMAKLDRGRNFVQRWNYRYRDGGIVRFIQSVRVAGQQNCRVRKNRSL